MLDRGAPSAHPAPPVPARVATEQATGVPEGVGEGVGRGEGVAVPEPEGGTEAGALGEALGEAPGDSEGEAVREMEGEAEGADTNWTLATKPLSCTLASVVKATVMTLPVLVHEPSAVPEWPETSAGKIVLGPLCSENLSQHSSVAM